MRFCYTHPDGSTLHDPDVGWIENQLRTGGAEHWQSHSVTAGLARANGPGNSITLMVQEPFGVMVVYCSANGADEHVLTDPSASAPDSDVTVYPGGNEWAVPRRYLVPIDQAMTPIRDFLSDGHCDTTTGWAILGRD